MRGLAGKLILALASTAVVLVVVELAVRWLAGRTVVYPGVIYRSGATELWCYDGHFNGEADWDLRRGAPYGPLQYAGNIDDDPRLEGLDPQAVYNAVEVRLNDLQFRERPEADLVEAMAGEGPVTLVVGDSFCFGQGVRLRDRFSDIIQADLTSRDRAHIVYNMCVPGMNIQRIARVQREAVKRFGAPARMLYSYTLNDPIRDIESRALEDSIYDLMHFRRRGFEAEYRSPLWRSAALRWLMERRTRQQVAARTVAWYQRLYGDNPGWRQTARVLAEMRAFCAARDIELALVVFPLFHQLGDYPLAQAHQQLKQAADGMPFVDLLEVFAGKDERDLWVHPTDFHPNGRAHRMAAEHLLAALAW